MTIKANKTAATLWAILLVGTGAGSALGDSIEVVTGEVLIVDEVRYRLTGIDAPEPGETCMLNGIARDCGIVARAQLLDLTAGATVTCTLTGTASAVPALARCQANGYDLSTGMVYTGWARALSDALAPVEADAKRARRGQWRDGSEEYPMR